MSFQIQKIKEFIAEFKDLIIVITKFLGTLGTVVGLITSLYFNYVNSKAIDKNTAQNETTKIELQVKDAQIEVLQAQTAKGNYE